MCFRLQTLVWKFLWWDWTFHWRVAERVAAPQTALCETQLPLPTSGFAGNLRGGVVGRRSEAPRATLACGILSSLVYADLGDLANAIKLRLTTGPRGLRLKLTLQSFAAVRHGLPDKWAGNQRKDTIAPSISKYFSSIYWPSLRKQEKKKPLVGRLELKIPKENCAAPCHLFESLQKRKHGS